MEVWELKLYFYPSAGGLKKIITKKMPERCFKIEANVAAMIVVVNMLLLPVEPYPRP